MVSKAKFQKKLNGHTRSCPEDANFVYFSVAGQSFLPQDIIGTYTQSWVTHGKIWFGHSIYFEILLSALDASKNKEVCNRGVIQKAKSDT